MNIGSHGSLKAVCNACLVSCILKESPVSRADLSLIKSSVAEARDIVVSALTHSFST